MPFAAGLRDTLRVRSRHAPSELAQGESLEHVLSRHLLAVEEMAEGELLTSVLLLDSDRKTLWHGAAPNLPAAYCEAIDGSEIGPCAGSCGTAAYLGEAVYVTDIESDPLWAHYRHLALPHGLRASWSTPIQDPGGTVIGTFAIYHRTPGAPTKDEIKSIAMITDHVAQAILCAQRAENPDGPASRQAVSGPALEIVRGTDTSGTAPDWADQLLRSVERLEAHAEELERLANESESEGAGEQSRAVAVDCRRLVSVIRRQIEQGRPS
jgi:GAF domain-containing protein